MEDGGGGGNGGGGGGADAVCPASSWGSFLFFLGDVMLCEV